MNLVTFLPFLRRPHQFTGADMSGSMAVHHDLLIGSLQSDPAAAVFLLQEKLRSFGGGNPISQVRQAVADLPLELSRRIETAPFCMFRDRGLYAGDWVGLGKSSDFADLALMRSGLSKPVPVCGIVHSALFPGVFQTYLSSIALNRPGDMFVATSAAAQRATKELLEQAWGVIHARREVLAAISHTPSRNR